MTLLHNPDFVAWWEARRSEDRDLGFDKGGATECRQCGAELADEVEGDVCLVCLAMEYAEERAEERLGHALKQIAHMVATGEPQVVGRFVSESVEHAIELASFLTPARD
jgi:hypothetical protein